LKTHSLCLFLYHLRTDRAKLHMLDCNDMRRHAAACTTSSPISAILMTFNILYDVIHESRLQSFNFSTASWPKMGWVDFL